METKTGWTHVDDGYLHKIVDGNGVEIASLNSAGDVADTENLANARLIAAAPEMYSLLELADELDDTADSDHDACMALEKIGNAARALLAKIKWADHALGTSPKTSG